MRILGSHHWWDTTVLRGQDHLLKNTGGPAGLNRPSNVTLGHATEEPETLRSHPHCSLHPHTPWGDWLGQAGLLWEGLNNTQAQLSCVVSKFCVDRCLFPTLDSSNSYLAGHPPSCL